MKALVLLLIILFLYALWKNLTPPKNLGISHKRLTPCPKKANCINSQSKDVDYAITPLKLSANCQLETIEKFFHENYKTKTIKKTDRYLYMVVTTPLFHFKDDVEFFVDSEKKTISLRSASRLGYSDLGTNRKRIEALRKKLNKT